MNSENETLSDFEISRRYEMIAVEARRWTESENCTRFWRNDDFIFTLTHGCSVPSLLLVVYSGVIGFVSICLIHYSIKSMIAYRAEFVEKLRASIDPAYVNEVVDSVRCCDLFRSTRFALFSQTIAFSVLFTGYAVTTSLLPFVRDEAGDASAMHVLQCAILVIYYACLLRVSQMTNVAATSEGETKTPSQRLTMTLVLPTTIAACVTFIGIASGMSYESARYAFATHLVSEFAYVLSVANDMGELGKTLQQRRVSLGIAMDSTNDVGERMMTLSQTVAVMHAVRTVALLGILTNVFSDNVGRSLAVVGLEIISQCELIAELFYIVTRLPKR